MYYGRWYASKGELQREGYRRYDVYAGRELSKEVELIHRLRQLHGRKVTRSSTARCLMAMGVKAYKADKRYQKLLNELNSGATCPDQQDEKERCADELQRLFCMLDSSDK